MSPLRVTVSSAALQISQNLGVDLATCTEVALAAKGESEFELLVGDQGLELNWYPEQLLSAKPKALVFSNDFEKKLKQLSSFPAPKQGAFNQALGKKTRRILDLSGGFGCDAFLMFTQGYEVTSVERHPLVAVLLIDALTRLTAHNTLPLTSPTAHFAQAIDFLNKANLDVDCIYLDPMFPPKRKKTAVSNKQMQLLQRMVGPDLDAAEVAQAACDTGTRVVIKRPTYADPLLSCPDHRFTSKLVGYDVYLPNAR